MDENTLPMQALVIAHAAYGHNSFFKGNYLFRMWTDASSIIDYLVYAKNYIAECEERHGWRAGKVQMAIDCLIVAVAFAIVEPGLVLLSVAGTFPILLLAAASVGMGSSVFHPEASRVARMASGGRYGVAQALFQVGGNLGGAVGPLLAAFVVLPQACADAGTWVGRMLYAPTRDRGWSVAGRGDARRHGPTAAREPGAPLQRGAARVKAP